MHKEDFDDVVSHQDDYVPKVIEVFRLPENTDIKKAKKVKSINRQIGINDVKNAIKRAEQIEENNLANASIKTPEGNNYYNNPDTQMHKVLLKLFKEVGIELFK